MPHLRLQIATSLAFQVKGGDLKMQPLKWQAAYWGPKRFWLLFCITRERGEVKSNFRYARSFHNKNYSALEEEKQLSDHFNIITKFAMKKHLRI